MKNAHKPDCNSLEERLRSDRPTFSAPEGFTDRVMERLGRQEPAPRTAPRNTPALRLFLGLAGATCLVLVAVKLNSDREPAADPQQLAEVISKIKVPEISVAQVEAFTAKLDEPLEIELKNVISDTRQAIQFVASNFLPEN